MKVPAIILAAVALLVIAFPAEAALPVNPVFNGGFEAYVPFAARTFRDAGVDQQIGVGHQVLGCGAVASFVWETDCSSKPVSREQALAQLTGDPQGEVGYWMSDKYERGDLATVTPAQQSPFTAAHWAQYPAESVTFQDVDANIEREAIVAKDGAFLYQTFLGTHSAVPMGLVDALTFRLEGGTYDGSRAYFQFVLDSFPVESQADWPQAFYNYQLTIPNSKWTIEGDVVSINPLDGTLSGPANGGYLVDDVDEHPTPAQWNDATPEEREAMLMEFRAIQISFWQLPLGLVLDDVAME